MITEEEKKFINYWEANRDVQKKFFYKLLVGLPMGLLSVVLSDWYKNLSFITSGQGTMIMIAVMGIIVFYALFRMHHKWERNEEFYQELKHKQNV
jgi:hypothetical protein